MAVRLIQFVCISSCSLTQVIDNFARLLVDWLRVALHCVPEPLRDVKFDLARRFAQMLKRQTSLNHLCQASRGVVYSNDITTQMLSDWSRVDIHSICKQTLYTMDMYTEREYHVVIRLYEEFESLLEERASIEAFIDWLHSLVDRCVVQASLKRPGSLRRTARQFLLTWSCFGTRIIRDMTLHSAVSFGSFHLLHLMFDDYVMYLVENLYSEERASDLLRSIKGETSLGMSDQEDEVVLPDPRFTSSTFNNPQCSYTSPLGVAMSSTPDRRQSVITDSREWSTSTPRVGYCHSPHPGSAAQSSGSPSQSYDARLDTSMTSLSSGDNNVATQMNNADPAAAAASDPGYQYGGYLSNMNTLGAHVALATNDMAAGYGATYTTPNNMQFGGVSRCYTNDHVTPNDWSDTQRYTQARNAGYVEGNHLSQTYYGMSRSESAAPACTYGAQSMRTPAQSSAALYQQYGYQDGYCPSGEDGVHDESTFIRKRKHDDVYPTDLAPKRVTSVGDYTYDMTSCYPRS
ncbi:hypothetical protein LSAT2_030210 [Lamellibrachia satsuma]|nr:hypothetical protein LSAT2_030210 [Lamellibrachia satsuma]